MGGLRSCSMLSLAFFSIISTVFLEWHSMAETVLEKDNSEEFSIDEFTVETSYGAVRGVDLGEARAFLGVPYASPPTEDLRWQPPQEPKEWRPEVYEATEKPAGCPQNCVEPLFVCPEEISEDCLYLNIYTPLDATPDSNLPVMVYIHDGNFVTSSGASSLSIDGRFIANMSSVVVVTFNYRLGALGWLVLGGSEPFTGNYGFLDQILALKFVKNNIAAFGGNPEKVTLFGQDSGSKAIALHLANSESNELFHQAILQSTPFSVPYKSMKEARNSGNQFKSFLNCSTLDCVKNQSVELILMAQEKIGESLLDGSSRFLQKLAPWGPVIDGEHVSMDSFNWLLEDSVQQKPLILGVTSEEARRQVYEKFPREPSYPTVLAFANLMFPPPFGTTVLSEYGINIFSEKLREPLSEGITDFLFVCPTRSIAQSTEAVDDNVVYSYVFDHALTFDAWKPYDMCSGHACHGAETMVVFYTASLAGFEYGAAEENLANKMVYYWGNFVHTGNPNNNSWRPQPVIKAEEWPIYKNESNWQSLLLRAPTNIVVEDYRQGKCKFWENIGYSV